MIIFINRECRSCCYRIYNFELKEFKYNLSEEPVPNCNRTTCLVDETDIKRFIKVKPLENKLEKELK